MDFVVQIKKGIVKANSKLWVDTEMISEIQKRGKLHSRYKKSGLEKEKIISKPLKYLFKNVTKEKNPYLEEKLSSKHQKKL